MSNEVDYEEVLRWLRLMRNTVYTDKERKIIEYIQEVLWIDNDMRNS
jgi:hypothetical protein